jgi:hypothetical protein
MFGPKAPQCFFGRDICLMADDSDHGEGEHDERDMAVPAR